MLCERDREEGLRRYVEETASGAGVRVLSVEDEPIDLEDVFRSLTHAAVGETA